MPSSWLVAVAQLPYRETGLNSLGKPARSVSIGHEFHRIKFFLSLVLNLKLNIWGGGGERWAELIVFWEKVSSLYFPTLYKVFKPQVL